MADGRFFHMRAIPRKSGPTYMTASGGLPIDAHLTVKNLATGQLRGCRVHLDRPLRTASASPRLPHSRRLRPQSAWLEDAGIPARVIDELMGHQAGRRGEREGSMIGTRYRHMTEAM
jgi:hypothetical protein